MSSWFISVHKYTITKYSQIILVHNALTLMSSKNISCNYYLAICIYVCVCVCVCVCARAQKCMYIVYVPKTQVHIHPVLCSDSIPALSLYFPDIKSIILCRNKL